MKKILIILVALLFVTGSAIADPVTLITGGIPIKIINTGLGDATFVFDGAGYTLTDFGFIIESGMVWEGPTSYGPGSSIEVFTNMDAVSTPLGLTKTFTFLNNTILNAWLRVDDESWRIINYPGSAPNPPYIGNGSPIYTTDPTGVYFGIQNPDNFDHLKMLWSGDSSTPGLYLDVKLYWEDLWNLGDKDFEDAIIEIKHTYTQPIPEPATMLLLGSGLIGLAGYARRRFKK